jgi:hypothetical protein
LLTVKIHRMHKNLSLDSIALVAFRKIFIFFA